MTYYSKFLKIAATARLLLEYFNCVTFLHIQGQWSVCLVDGVTVESETDHLQTQTLNQSSDEN